MAILGTFRSFVHDARGQFTIIFALISIPLMLSIGVAVDYSRMTLVRQELQAAADAAALAAVAKKGETFQAGGLFSGNWSKGQAQKSARDWFDVNYVPSYGQVIDKADVDIKRVGVDLSATVTVQATVPATFMQFASYSANPVSVTSTAKSTLAPYTDVYVLADNTPSMGLAATPLDITALQGLTGCAFACHDLSSSNNSYVRALAAGITVRIDATSEALAALMTTMATATQQTNQFRVAGYSFGTRIEQQQVTNFIPQTSNLIKAATDALTLKIMTIPYAGYNKQMATDLSKMMSGIATVVGTSGGGSPPTILEPPLRISGSRTLCRKHPICRRLPSTPKTFR